MNEPRITIVIPVKTTPEEDRIDREVEEYFAKKHPPKIKKLLVNDRLKKS